VTNDCCQPKEPHPSEIARNDAERDHLLAQARKEIAYAEKAELELAKARRAEQAELAKNEHHFLYVFDQEVSASSVKSCISQLATWHRQYPECAIEIQLNSPGGSIFDGLALIDFVRDLRVKGHHITIVTIGMAASMAGVILQAADTRVMGHNALMLIHEGSLGAVGDFGKVEDRVKLMKQLHERILALFVERSKVSKGFITRHWQRRDWWLSAEECLKHGFIDEVR
jgi:ATP-dependent Clp endopeptidase proteolytic subunit ClpP